MLVETDKARMLHEAYIKARRDERAERDYEREVAHEEGMVIGVTKGREEERVKIARRMLHSGRPPDEISEFTGLSEVELNLWAGQVQH